MRKYEVVLLSEKGRLAQEDEITRRLEGEGFPTRLLRSIDDLWHQLPGGDTHTILFAEYRTWAGDTAGLDALKEFSAACHDRGISDRISLFLIADRSDMDCLLSLDRGWVMPSGFLFTPVNVDELILMVRRTRIALDKLRG